MKFASRLKKIRPSATMAMAARARSLAATGREIIDLGLGEPDFDTPLEIKLAAIDAIRKGFTKYTPPAGIEELKRAIATKLLKENGLRYQNDEIIVSCGAKHSLYNLAQVLFGPGDEVIIPAPYWVTYPDQILLAEAEPVIVPTREEDGFLLTPESLSAAITPRTRALIINSPSNPTGAVYDREMLERIAAICLQKDLLIISGEIYEKFIYQGARHFSIASLSEEVRKRTIVVNGVSKSAAMTGWRIGYAAGPREIIAAMTTVQSQSTSNPTSISQKAAVAALTEAGDFARKMVDEFDRRRRAMVQRLNKLPGARCQIPAGAFYLFPHFSKGSGPEDDVRLAERLLEEAGVATVPGTAFGAAGYLRISYALPLEKLTEAMDRIEKALLRRD